MEKKLTEDENEEKTKEGDKMEKKVTEDENEEKTDKQSVLRSR